MSFIKKYFKRNKSLHKNCYMKFIDEFDTKQKIDFKTEHFKTFVEV